MPRKAKIKQFQIPVPQAFVNSLPKIPKLLKPKEREALVENAIDWGMDFGQGIGGGVNPTGYPGNQSPWMSAQLSQPTTEFINLRWYLVSNMRQFLSEMYVELGLVQKIVDTPVDDALRGGVSIKSKQISEQELEELTGSLDRDDNLTVVGDAAKWNRLYGGGGILILTDQDPSEPLDLESIDSNTPLEFRAVDLWELFWDKQNTEGYDPAVQSYEAEYYNYYGEQVHKTRVMRMKGLTAPSFIRPRLRGWGFSVVETLVRSLNQYLKATDLIYEVLDEFKVDVYKIKGLVNTLLSADGQNKVKERVAQANYHKNYQHAVVMDKEDEWDHKQLSFAGIAETMESIRMQVASDMSMPMTKLFGISSAGFNSGEDDIEVYNSMVESQVRNKIKYIILRLCEIKCQQLFGFVPDDLSIEFKPLRVLSGEQEENVKTQRFTRLLQARQAGEISDDDFRAGCNREKLLGITLDEETDSASGGYDANKVEEGANNPEDPQDIDNPGAGRLDTRKSRATEVGGASKDPPAPRGSDVPDNIARISKSKNWLKGIVKNSPAFDIASYEADGGDSWIDDRRRYFYEDPASVDKALWERAKEASRAAYKEVRWKFVTWWYKKQGGKFG